MPRSLAASIIPANISHAFDDARREDGRLEEGLALELELDSHRAAAGPARRGFHQPRDHPDERHASEKVPRARGAALSKINPRI